MCVFRSTPLVFCTILVAASVTTAVGKNVGLTKCPNDTYFACDNGECILKTLICDGNNDCGNEITNGNNCEAFPCAVVKFTGCVNDSCIVPSNLCGGSVRCINSTDENIAMCQSRKCDSKTEFKCDVGRCITKDVLCDGFIDCTDGIDENEQFCESRTCESTAPFQCDKGRCLKHDAICNGISDCTDGKDEHDDYCQPITCPPDKICLNSYKCMDNPTNCDVYYGHQSNIWNSGYSRVCQKNTHFRCDDGKCISNDLRCNHFYDCKGKEDEANCSYKCPDNYFKCDSEDCIHYYRTCNGYNDCIDGSDEKKEICKTQPLESCPPTTHKLCKNKFGQFYKCILEYMDCLTNENERWWKVTTIGDKKALAGQVWFLRRDLLHD